MKLLLTSADSKGEVGSTDASAIVIIIAVPCGQQWWRRQHRCKR